MNIDILRQQTIQYMGKEGLSQNYFAKKLNIPVSSFNNFIHGCSIASKHLVKLGDFLNISDPNEKQETAQSLDIKRELERVELNEVEEVVDALLQGETVYVENSNHSLQLRQGFITRFSPSGKVISVNSPVIMEEFYYLLQPKKIQIELGGRYLTEHQEEVFIFKYVDGKFYGVCKGHDLYYKFLPDGTGCDFDDLIKEA
jgi:plasmid maintenance system antidote protein VapI